MPGIFALALTLVLPVVAPGAPAADCKFSRGNPIGETSSWYDQFKCYQGAGRHVSVVGSPFDAGSVSGGVCVASVARDRVQLAPCGSFAGDGAMILPYSAIAYVVDDGRSDVVNIYVTALFHR